jgi:hypothetical protein
MITKNLAAAIERDLLADRPAAKFHPRCFICDVEFTPRRSTNLDDNSWFCSARCRAGFDAGLPPHNPQHGRKSNPRWYRLSMGAEGFVIECAGCHRTFDSKGLRYCSVTCERKAREREANQAAISEAGMDAHQHRNCEACGGRIPRWRNGRAVSKATRFCSDRCSAKARRQSGSRSELLSPETAKKCPSNGFLAEPAE